MNRPTSHHTRIAGCLFMVAAMTLPAACGSPTTPATSPVPKASFDQALHDRLPHPVKNRGVLRVGTEASYAPMESFGPDGRTIIGAEPDLGVEIGRVLGVHLKFVDTGFTNLVPKVTHGDLDLAMSAMTDTAERSRITDFVDYFSAGTTIVVQQSAAAKIGRHSSEVRAAISPATALRVPFGSRRSSANSAGNAIALQNAAQNFCSSAPQAISLPSLAG
jgi:polar amino acid transport system substrate-binding protein